MWPCELPAQVAAMLVLSCEKMLEILARDCISLPYQRRHRLGTGQGLLWNCAEVTDPQGLPSKPCGPALTEVCTLCPFTTLQICQARILLPHLIPGKVPFLGIKSSRGRSQALFSLAVDSGNTWELSNEIKKRGAVHTHVGFHACQFTCNLSRKLHWKPRVEIRILAIDDTGWVTRNNNKKEIWPGMLFIYKQSFRTGGIAQGKALAYYSWGLCFDYQYCKIYK